MEPQELTYETIQNLIAQEIVERGQLRCQFRCPRSEQTIQAQADIAQANRDSLKTKMKLSAKQGLMRSMSRQLSMLVRSVVGHGAVGRVANDLVSHTTQAAHDKDVFNVEEKRKAAVVAFQQVAGQFAWDETLDSFVLPTADAPNNSAKPCGSETPKAATALPIALLSALLGAAPAAAQAEGGSPARIVFTVGGDKAAGKALAGSLGGRWAKNPTKAFKLAAKKINAGGAMDVTIRIAAGTYEGDLGSGAFTMPSFKNPAARLCIQGGFAKDFAARDAFGTPTRFSANENRSAPLMKFRISTPRNQDVLEALVLDGILMDVAGSNKYDKKTNSLLKGASCTFVVINFGYMMTDLLELKNCVFLNSPHRCFETLIRCKTAKAEIRLTNNLFLNCVIPVKLDSCRGRLMPAKITVDHCSFLLNWAYNPSINTSNPAALELGPNYAAKEVHITNSLFYSNFGGAILALHKQLPAMTITDNNFVGNGLLHGQVAPDAVAMIVEASGRKQPINVETIEDIDAVEEFENNVTVAPGIPVALGKVQAVDARSVKVDASWENQARSILGLNLRGGKVDIKDYAPRKGYDPAKPPVPQSAAAAAYGFAVAPGKALQQ